MIIAALPPSAIPWRPVGHDMEIDDVHIPDDGVIAFSRGGYA
jgi:hypothetical protein